MLDDPSYEVSFAVGGAVRDLMEKQFEIPGLSQSQL